MAGLLRDFGDTRWNPDQIDAGSGRSLYDDQAAFDQDGGQLPPGLRQRPAIRGRVQAPNWAPGEFDEWKRARVLGVPTAYGKQKQRDYEMSRGGLGRNPSQTITGPLQFPQLTGPLGLLQKGIR